MQVKRKNHIGPLLWVLTALSGLLFASLAQADFIPVENVAVSQKSVTLAGYTRNVIIIKPASGTTGKVPAIVLLHYRNGNPIDYSALSDIGRLVRDTGLWVIMPQSGQLQKLVGVQYDWNWKQSSGGDNDVAFLSALITQSVADYPIDPHRIFMGGYSSGGAMSQTFACNHPEQVAGIALVGAKLTTGTKKACQPSLGTPVIMFAGTEDHTAPYNASIGQLSMLQTAQFWAQTAGCSTTPVGTDLPAGPPDNTNTSVHLDVFSGCSSYGGVSFYTINGGGHSWPGTLDFSPLLGAVTQQINATTLIGQFFSTLSRP